MTPERWQQIDHLFHSALEREYEERAAFLAQACDGDESLRQEVESLIGSHGAAHSFIEATAADIAAELLANRETQLTSGQYVGHYEVISLLGGGGMGEVYLAQDVRLGRQVALKRLPAQFNFDADRVHRFKQEARAVSALNHPNIVTIHEIGRLNSLHFIATEFIEGETLRQHMSTGWIKPDEVLDVVIQIASALTAAHAAGIVHRDVKPENIMIRPDGYVKVLDFGLAKLIEQKKKAFLGLEESISGQNQTSQGLILGTVNYMSPEQAKGEVIDERTDIFSFGAVIYEMISGRTPFAGNSTLETLANLINAEPPPLSSLASNVPNELQRIVCQALRKNKDKRYQTMKALLADLKDLLQNPTWEKEWERSQSLNDETVSVLQATTDPAKKQTTETQYSFSQHITNPKQLLRDAHYPTVSPDHRFIVYRERVGSELALLRMDLNDGSQKVLTTGVIHYPTFSPDGKWLVFTKYNDRMALWKVPVEGGEPTRILVENALCAAVSPDARTIAFVLRRGGNPNRIALVSLDGGEIIKIFDAVPESNPLSNNQNLQWTLDGRSIYYIALNNGVSNIRRQSLDGSPPTQVTQFTTGRIFNFAYSPDGKQLALSRGSLDSDVVLIKGLE